MEALSHFSYHPNTVAGAFTQFVNSPTRHDSHHLTSSLLDLIITPSPSNLVSATSVVSSHEISDHDLALANLNTKRLKSPQRTYQYRNIKDIDLQSFQHNILSSSLVSDPDPTVDGYADQMESVITSALDRAAPLKTGRRSGPRKAKNWLSPDVIEAKKRRRRLERRWKASNAEPDRLAYRAACSTTNKLITHSRAASNLKCINEASSHPKQLWGTIKSLLHSSPRAAFTFSLSTLGKFPGIILPTKDSYPQEFHFLKIAWQPFPFWFWSTPSGRIAFQFHSCHTNRSHSATPLNVEQIITTWLCSHVTFEIMCWYFFHHHLTSGKPIFQTRYFPFQVRTGTRFATSKEAWLT